MECKVQLKVQIWKSKELTESVEVVENLDAKCRLGRTDLINKNKPLLCELA